MIQNQYASSYFKETVFPDFLKHFKSRTSIVTYCSDLNLFLEFVKKDFLDITKEDVQQYFDNQKKKMDSNLIKESTVAKKFRELHSLSDFIIKNDHGYDIPASFDDFFYPYLLQLEKISNTANTIPLQHMDLILQAASDDIMIYCLLVFLFQVGLSTNEVIELELSDFAEYDNGLFVYIKKRKRSCFVPKDVDKILKQYLKERQENPFLFYNSRGRKLNVMYISRLMERYCKAAGVPKYSAQMLRGACASKLFSYDIPESIVANQLGVTTSQIKRYKNKIYKDQLSHMSEQFVKLKVELPKRT